MLLSKFHAEYVPPVKPDYDTIQYYYIYTVPKVKTGYHGLDNPNWFCTHSGEKARFSESELKEWINEFAKSKHVDLKFVEV